MKTESQIHSEVFKNWEKYLPAARGRNGKPISEQVAAEYGISVEISTEIVQSVSILKGITK